MSEAEANLARSRIDVKVAQTRLVEAEKALREGKLKALAEYNATVDRLEQEVVRARLAVEKEETYVRECEHKINNPFQNDS